MNLIHILGKITKVNILSPINENLILSKSLKPEAMMTLIKSVPPKELLYVIKQFADYVFILVFRNPLPNLPIR